MSPRASTSSIRVRYAETDQMGVAHHAEYFAWFEVGRTDLLRETGTTYRELEADGLRLPVIEATARYLRPVLYDDLLEVRTEVTTVGGARVGFSYEVRRAGTEGPLATGTTQHATVDAKGRPRRLQEPARRRFRIAFAEDGGACHQDFRPRLDQRADVAHIHAAVHLDLRLEAAVLDDAAQAADLVEGSRDELLPAEAGVHGHHEHVVELGQDLVERRQGRGGVEGHPRPNAPLAQERDLALQVRHRFLVQRDPGRPRVHEGLQVPVRVLDHQVNVEGKRRGLVEGRHDGRAERDVGDEMTVHDVDVHERRPTAGGARDLFREAREVGRKDRRGEDHGPLWLTSRLIAVWGFTRYPESGAWRSTRPAGAPGYAR